MKELSSKQELSEELEQLGDRVKSAQNANAPEDDARTSGWAVGVNYASTFVGSIVVGGLLGFSIDYFAHSQPWGTIVGVILGFMAGTRSIVQMAQKLNKENEQI